MCRQTKMFLNAREIPFEEINIEDHPEYIDEIHAMGLSSAPVVIPDPESGIEPWGGFRPDQLKKLMD